MRRPLVNRLDRITDPAVPPTLAFDQCSEAIPNDLFTVMRFHVASMEVERVHSSLPETYPVGGRKPKRETEWGDKVLTRQLLNVGHGREDIEWAFGDHETILGLGLKAVLNVPILRGERVLGTINYLRKGPAFNEVECTIGRLLAAALAMRGETILNPAYDRLQF